MQGRSQNVYMFSVGRPLQIQTNRHRRRGAFGRSWADGDIGPYEQSRPRRVRPPGLAVGRRGHSTGAHSKQGNVTRTNFTPRAAAGGDDPRLLIFARAPDGARRQGSEVSEGKFLETVGF